MSRFDTTRWSMILHARRATPDARAALDGLCRRYRGPVLAYVRHYGYAHDVAEDLVQAFFTAFIEHAWHASADPARGRFRSFLLTTLKRFLISRRVEGRRLKRGGGVRFEAVADDAPDLVDSDGPEAAFERAWAVAVIEAALARLRAEAEAAGKLELFEQLSEFLVERPDEADYARVATALHLRRNTLAVAVHRLRQRLRELVRAEIGDTAADHDELVRELRDLRGALAGVAHDADAGAAAGWRGDSGIRT